MNRLRRLFRALFCPSSWVADDPSPDLRQERIAASIARRPASSVIDPAYDIIEGPLGEVPPMTPEQASRLWQAAGATAGAEEATRAAQVDQHRAAHTSRDGIPYDVETAAAPDAVEPLALSAWPGLRSPWTGSTDDERMAELGIDVPGVTR